MGESKVKKEEKVKAKGKKIKKSLIIVCVIMHEPLREARKIA